MKTFYASLLAVATLVACEQSTFQIKLDRALKIDARETQSLPAGDYKMLLESRMAATRVTLSSDQASAQTVVKIRIKNSTASEIQRFYQSTAMLLEKNVVISSEELKQPFSLNLKRSVNEIGRSEAREEEQGCVLSRETVQDGETCSYPPSCQTQYECKDFSGSECSSGDAGCNCGTSPVDPSSPWCEWKCEPNYVEHITWGTQTATVHDVSYRILSQGIVEQDSIKMGAIDEIVKSSVRKENISAGLCHD